MGAGSTPMAGAPAVEECGPWRTLGQNQMENLQRIPRAQMADADQQKILDPGRTSGRLQKDCLLGGSPIVHGRVYQRSTSEGNRTAAHSTGRCVRRLKAWSIGQLIAIMGYT